MNEHICILLTMTVNINSNKIWSILNEPDLRLDIYLKSIKKWLEETDLNIVVVENSGYKFHELDEFIKKYQNRFEIILFNEKHLEDDIFDVNEAKALRLSNDYLSTSKGTSEMFAIYYAYLNSWIIKKCDFLIKITGRYYIPFFDKYISTISLTDYDVLRQNSADRCEIIGCSIKKVDLIFKPNNFRASHGFYIHHIEDLYKDRITQFDPKKVFICKNFLIEKTFTGGGYECSEL